MSRNLLSCMWTTKNGEMQIDMPCTQVIPNPNFFPNKCLLNNVGAEKISFERCQKNDNFLKQTFLSKCPQEGNTYECKNEMDGLKVSHLSNALSLPDNIKDNEIRELHSYFTNLDDYELIKIAATKGHSTSIKKGSKEYNTPDRPKWLSDEFIKKYIKQEWIAKILIARHPNTINLLSVDKSISDYPALISEIKTHYKENLN